MNVHLGNHFSFADDFYSSIDAFRWRTPGKQINVRNQFDSLDLELGQGKLGILMPGSLGIPCSVLIKLLPVPRSPTLRLILYAYLGPNLCLIAPRGQLNTCLATLCNTLCWPRPPRTAPRHDYYRCASHVGTHWGTGGATRGQLKTSVSEYPKLVEWVYKDYDQKRVT